MRWRGELPGLRRLLRSERGAVMVEFVVVLPFLFLLLFAIAEIGRGLWYHHIITKGVRDGVRHLSRTALTADAVEQAINVAMRGSPDDDAKLLLGHWSDPDTVDVTVIEVPHDGEFRFPNPVLVVQMTAEVPINFFLLSFFGLDPMLTLQVRDQQRHIGE